MVAMQPSPSGSIVKLTLLGSAFFGLVSDPGKYDLARTFQFEICAPMLCFDPVADVRE